MRTLYGLFFFIILVIYTGCVDYTPKPKGYFRIEPAEAVYQPFLLEELPYTFDVSRQATVEIPPVDSLTGWLNLSYPELAVKIYCSYFPLNFSSLEEVEAESRELVLRQARQVHRVHEQEYSDPERSVYATLFLLDGESASPVQFLITDRQKHFFRGAMYYNCSPNADSLAPVTNYIRKDIIELIQTFNWK
ncbi:MAG: gliding motility protein GldD [Tannerellaceae bacterium]|nr:gliding motility protein GldD [Tannerellaceae bacterium]MCD8264472.1 gliding motility protein GldD [Tannerellaceae bacterium]